MLPYYIRGHIFCAVPRGTSGQRHYGISVDGLHVEERVTGGPVRRDEQKGRKRKEKKRNDRAAAEAHAATCH
jgi:hypothetical protein